MEPMAKQTFRLFKRGNVWWYRRRIPKDLLDQYGGKKEVAYSLDTEKRAEAITKRDLENVRWNDEFDEKRRRKGGAPTRTLSDAQMDQMVVAWFHRFDEHGERATLRAGPPDRRGVASADAVRDLESEIGEWADPHDEAALAQVQEVATDLLADHHVSLDPGGEQFQRLCDRVRRGIVEQLRRGHHHLVNGYAGAGSSFDSFFADAGFGRPEPDPVPDDGAGITVSELTEMYMADPGRNRSQKTVDGYRVIFRALRELLGADKPVRNVTREDCRRVRDVLVSLPPNATKRFKRMTLEQAAAHARAEDLPTLKPKAANSYLHNLSALFRWAAREEYVARNPAEGLRVATNGDQGDGNAPFSPDQLHAIFAAPIYTGCVDDGPNYNRPGPNRPRGWRFWIPVLGLHTGARLNELCQLRVADVEQVGGVHVIHVRPGKGQRVKTKAGRRTVPVHPGLVEIGFLEFVRQQRDAGHERLFPDIREGSSGYLSDTAQKWFSRFLSHVGAKQGRQGFHAFRHTMTRALREAGVPADRIRDMLGWEGGGMEEGAYWSPLEARTYHEEMSKARLPVDLSHLTENR